MAVGCKGISTNFLSSLADKANNKPAINSNKSRHLVLQTEGI